MNNRSTQSKLFSTNATQDSRTWCPYKYNVEHKEPPTNRYVYVKQNFVQSFPQPDLFSTRVHINPNFNKKVFVNPNFQGNMVQPYVRPSVHVNPNSQNIKLQMTDINQKVKAGVVDVINGSNKIHVNPNILKTIPVPVEKNTITPTKNMESTNKILYLSKTKLVRNPEKVASQRKTRRISICSNYKIIKSNLLRKKMPHDKKCKTKLVSPVKYKILKVKTTPVINRRGKYKLDNRVPKDSSNQIGRKVSKICIKRSNSSASLLKIGNILYKKSLHSLKRTSAVKKGRNSSILKTNNKLIIKSKYTLVKKRSINKNNESRNSFKRTNSNIKLRPSKGQKPVVSPGKLRKCNIPCLMYRKFGRCKAYEKGRCFKKHDPDQIALCTKFLQGACVSEKCLLSHNVSSEKMPTCKYYLEGSCSKDECPYLHVRISPKADICNDFLEGFCKKAKECDKRHQFLCPEFEKHGNCLKQRCPYPHGMMVRKYSVFNKDHFAKKSSEIKTKPASDVTIETKTLISDKKIDTCNEDNAVKKRYYADSKLKPNSLEVPGGEQILENDQDEKFNLTSRPRLGSLPSYIAFQDS